MGFGTNKMSGSDIILFTYSKGTFNCYDLISIGYKIILDTANAGIKNVKYVTGNAVSMADPFAPYMTHISWTCTKDVSAPNASDFEIFSKSDATAMVI